MYDNHPGSEHFSKASQRLEELLECTDPNVELDLGSWVADITLNKFLKDIPRNSVGPIVRSTDAARDSSNVDDAASLNTRNEYWTISSYRTRSQSPPSEWGGIESVDDRSFPIPPDLSGDFTLPLESLLKPMKKNTYSPVNQENVQKFLDGATWQAEPPVEQKETLWTAKKLPLLPMEQPVGVLPGSPVVGATPTPRQQDRFLESIEVARSHSYGNVAGPERGVMRRPRLQRYPGRETVYTEFMRHEITDANTYHISIQKISTQTSNPPTEWYRRQHHRDGNIHQETAAAGKVEIPKPQPVAHKVYSFPYVINIGMCRVLRESCLGRVSSVDAYV
jgi:hypothetical protein